MCLLAGLSLERRAAERPEVDGSNSPAARDPVLAIEESTRVAAQSNAAIAIATSANAKIGESKASSAIDTILSVSRFGNGYRIGCGDIELDS